MIRNLNFHLILDWPLNLILLFHEKDKIPYYLIKVDEEEPVNSRSTGSVHVLALSRKPMKLPENEMIKADLVEAG